MRIKAAVDARKESGSDIVIVARTDSRQALSLEESLWRARALGNAGADVLFIDALASKEEMEAFCEVCPQVPKMVIHFTFKCFRIMKSTMMKTYIISNGEFFIIIHTFL